MPRPKSPDRKLPVTLRIPASVVKLYLQCGEDWREHMQAAVIAAAGLALKPAPEPAKPSPDKAKVAVPKAAPKGRLVGFTPSGEPIYR